MGGPYVNFYIEVMILKVKHEYDDTALKELLPSRDELIRQAESLRNIYGPSWVTNVPMYLFLLETKRNMGIYPLRAMRKSDLEKYPNIEFMEIKSEQKAQMYLSGMNAGQIFRLICDIEMALESYTYVTIQNKIKDFKSEIDRHGYRNIYAIDPDAKIPAQKKNPGKRGTINSPS